MNDVHPRSFDPPRDRPAPRVLRGYGPGGEPRTVALTRMTLLVVIKPHCDGCRDFLYGERDAFANVDVALVSATASEEWLDAPRDVLVAPRLLDELEIRSAPFYVLIDPSDERVVCEGVPFALAHVASEIARYVAP